MTHFSKQSVAGAITLLLFFTTGFAPGIRGEAGGKAEKPELRSRAFEFRYIATLPAAPQATKRLNVWLPYPTTDAHQEIFDVRVSATGTHAIYTEPKYGNAILFVTMADPQPGPVEIQMTFKARRTENLRNDFANVDVKTAALDPGVEMYLKPDRLVPVTGEIRKWAMEVTRGKKTDSEKARAIYDYTIATMKYDKSGKGWGRGDIIYACDEKRGNCTDFHAVFIGFCRAVGIPARFAIGFSLPEQRGAGEIPGYHCWAEFYLKGYGWVPVDASEAWRHAGKKEYFFGGHDENRIQFSIGRDIALRPRPQGEPLNYFIYPYAEADGKSVGDIKRGFHFKDLRGGGEAQ